jgi:hypothetical protein
MSLAAPLFDGDDGSLLHDDAGHVLFAGRSGTGKTMLAVSLIAAKLCNPRWCVFVVDPEGDISPRCLEYLASPAAPLQRRVHYLKPASEHAFALPFLAAPDRDPQACHEKAVLATRVLAEAGRFDDGQLGPRLNKFFYLGALGLALTGRSLVDLPELYAHGAHYLREVIAAAYAYPFLSDELRGLDLLNTRTFSEYRDPLISRLMPIFGNPQLRRVFGPQDPPLDFAHIRAARENVFLDLAGLEHDDACIVGNAFTSLVYHAALRTPANTAPHTCLLIDEAFDYLKPLARGFDRLRKRNVQVIVLLQRLAQLSNASADDRTAMLSAALTNTASKVVFGGLAPDDADLMVRVLHSGSVDLQEWKPLSARPTAVGSRKEISRSASSAQHAARHEAVSETRSLARGFARTHMLSVTQAEGESETDAVSQASALGSLDTEAFGSAASAFDGISSSASMDPASGGLFLPATPTSIGTGASSGTGTTEVSTRASGRSQTDISGSSRALSRSRMTAVTEGVATSESEVHGVASSTMRGQSRGSSETEGVSETFVTSYAVLPTQMYALPEQLHRLAGALINLAPRQCIVKLGARPPFRTRTTTVQAAFRSHFAKRVMLPIFLASLRAHSPYLLPASHVDAALRARSIVPTQPEILEPDFAAAEPMPDGDPVHDPAGYAAGFWSRKEANKDPPGRSPKSHPDSALRILDGGKADADDGDNQA